MISSEKGLQGNSTDMIRKLKSGEFRIYSRHADKKTGKRKNLGTFASRAAAGETRTGHSVLQAWV